MSEYRKPIPVPSLESRPYWEALRERRLVMQQCDDCSRHWFPPSTHCPNCLSTKFTWATMSGRGRIFSYVVYHRVYHPEFADDVPYAVAVVQLEEGPRMISNVIGAPVESLLCDLPVEVVFDDITPTATLPKFRPRDTLLATTATEGAR
jgi:uncharacterized OB-fold protein